MDDSPLWFLLLPVWAVVGTIVYGFATRLFRDERLGEDGAAFLFFGILWPLGLFGLLVIGFAMLLIVLFKCVAGEQ